MSDREMSESEQRAWELDLRHQRQLMRSRKHRENVAGEESAKVLAQARLAKEELRRKPPIEMASWEMSVHRKKLADGDVVWRMVMRKDRKKVVQTPWKPRHKFLQDLAIYQPGLWTEWMTEGMGRPHGAAVAT